MNEWLPGHLPVLITNFFLLCARPIRLKNILYHVCFDNTDSLPGDDDDGDDDVTGAISTCDVEATHDEVVEIWRKQVTWYSGILPHVFSEISLYICSFLDVAVWNFWTSVFVCSCAANIFYL